MCTAHPYLHSLLKKVYSLVLKTSLAFLLVFRLNRCAMRFWEARGLWGNVTHNTRNLVGGILMYCGHSPRNRDMAIRWASSFCVAAMHFIRSEHEYNPDELAGFLSRDQISKMQDANHAPLYAASMVRHYLHRAFKIDAQTPPPLAHAYAIQMNNLEQYASQLVAQVSGMEKIRSTPLPIAYVSHLRTFLLAYTLFLPYVWVKEWGWATIPLVAFTAFALFGIEGASSEVEIPFDRSRPNHLALDAYCLIMLDSLQGLVVHDANLHMQGDQDDFNDDDTDNGDFQEEHGVTA
jgi:putative membrane protein